ncbi:MAG: FAD-dependent oxidoreductase [Candidatus Hadarchaeum sp.]|uniref:FAD-dependent oxidoreductase n=1 Tax=Candidatus Hadarchaeum sp. TaxID=2883567 RepID=UPI0031752F37
MKFDVVVIGAGSAGCMAALAAARVGATVALIEKYGFPGGTPVTVGISSLAPFHYGDRQVVTGIPQEFVDRLQQVGGTLGHMKVENEYGTGSYVCLFDRELYKHVLLEMLKENGVNLFMHTIVCEVTVKDNALIGVIVDDSEGKNEIKGKVFVDCTGDAVVAYYAGCPTVVGREKDGKVQPATLMFEMAEIDVPVLWDYLTKHTNELEWFSRIYPSVQPPNYFNSVFFVAQGFGEKLKQCPEFERLGRDTVLFFTGLRRGIVSFNSTRMHLSNPVSAVDLTKAEIEGRAQISVLEKWLRSTMPGFEDAYLSWVGVKVGVRESRRIVGRYVLSKEDIVASSRFPDSIAKGFFPIDVHDPSGRGGYSGGSLWIPLKSTYDIPYRSLIPQVIDNLLVAGRCISVTHEALGSTRVASCCMALGQAAGVAAALASQLSVPVPELSLNVLQQWLARVGQTF